MGLSISFSTAKTLVGERRDVLILKMQAWCASVSVGLFVCLCLSVSSSVCLFRPLSVCLSLCPSVSSSVHVFCPLSVCFVLCLSVSSSVCLSALN